MLHYIICTDCINHILPIKKFYERRLRKYGETKKRRGAGSGFKYSTPPQYYVFFSYSRSKYIWKTPEPPVLNFTMPKYIRIIKMHFLECILRLRSNIPWTKVGYLWSQQQILPVGTYSTYGRLWPPVSFFLLLGGGSAYAYGCLWTFWIANGWLHKF